MIESFLRFLKMNDVEYQENQSIKELSTVGVGQIARLIVYPRDIKQICDVVCFLEDSQIGHKIIGRMSNILFPDTEYSEVLIKTDKMRQFTVQGNRIIADAGVALPFLARLSGDIGLSGLEELSGIPGSLGGAILGNAGAFGREISDLAVLVNCFDIRNKKILSLRNTQSMFSYRQSIFKDSNLLILSAELSLRTSSADSVKARIAEYKKIRLHTQPVGEKSLGSTFKKTDDGISAGLLIDRCGLKGFSIGGAKISDKHAGFIVNKGFATAKNYLDLMEYAKQRVKEKFGVLLHEEIEIIK